MLALALVALLLPLAPGRAEATAPLDAGAAAAGGLELRSATRLTERLEELVVTSPALQADVRVRVLTPSGFDPTTDRLPVLWLLHGGFGSAADWTTAGAAEALTEGLPMVVVMPDAGTGGWYSDWLRPSSEGPQRWETFHLEELRPFVEARYAARTDRGGRAVAGLSMGGFGAAHAAARHPDLFGFAASFSGAVHLLHPGISAVVTASPLAHGGLPGSIFGERVVEEPRWRAHNPVDLAANLRTVEVVLRTGDGRPAPGGDTGDPIQEIGVRQAADALSARLADLGIDHTYVVHPGVHAWSYWRDDLAATLPAVAAHFARPPAAPPATAAHVALERRFAVWDHTVALDGSVLDRTTLVTRPDGFSLTGRGRGTVTTPPRYDPGEPVAARAGGRTSVLEADGAGRLVVPVDLGPAPLVPELPLLGSVPPAKTTTVVLTPHG